VFGRRRRREAENNAIAEEIADEQEETTATVGPFDSDEAPDDDVRRLDLGSMRVPTPAGVEARMQTDERGNVRQITLIHGDSAVQIGVFAAPRSEEIWEEVREEITASVAKQGGKLEELDGEYGVELLVRATGQQGTAATRFVGVDGPRWFLRAVFQGAIALDPEASELLNDCVRGVIVDRGTQPMPVLEGLPLRLPANMAEQAKAKLAANKGETAAPAPAGAAPAITGGTGSAGATSGAVNGSRPTGQTRGGGGRRKPSPKPKRR